MMNIILLLHEIDYVSISYCIVLSIIHSTISIAYISKRGGKERKAELTELMNLENCNVYLLYSKQFIFTHSEYILDIQIKVNLFGSMPSKSYGKIISISTVQSSLSNVYL